MLDAKSIEDPAIARHHRPARRRHQRLAHPPFGRQRARARRPVPSPDASQRARPLRRRRRTRGHDRPCAGIWPSPSRNVQRPDGLPARVGAALLADARVGEGTGSGSGNGGRTRRPAVFWRRETTSSRAARRRRNGGRSAAGLGRHISSVSVPASLQKRSSSRLRWTSRRAIRRTAPARAARRAAPDTGARRKGWRAPGCRRRPPAEIRPSGSVR